MLWTFKKVPMEITKKLTSRLSISIDQRWTRCLVSERKMREAQLAQLFIDLKPKVVKRNVESYRKKFNLKPRTLKILQGKSEELAL